MFLLLIRDPHGNSFSLGVAGRELLQVLFGLSTVRLGVGAKFQAQVLLTWYFAGAFWGLFWMLPIALRFQTHKTQT